MRVDTVIATLLVATYFLLVVFQLPSAEYVRAIGSAVVLFAAVAIAARVIPPGRVPPVSVLAVAFVAVAVLWMPTFPAMGGSTPAAVPIGFVGVQAAALLWAAIRWHSPGSSVRLLGCVSRFVAAIVNVAVQNAVRADAGR